jgi:hypothetical protein
MLFKDANFDTVSRNIVVLGVIFFENEKFCVVGKSALPVVINGA